MLGLSIVPLMSLLPLAALGVLVALVLFWLHLWFWGRRFFVGMSYAREERCRAADGGVFELRRLSDDASGPPVLLVHGIAVNHRSVDALPSVSMARELQERGRDVWLLTLRSGVFARWWRILLRQQKHVRFEAMCREDIPAAIERVCELSGHSRIDYVGYSMGGMLFYAALAAKAIPRGRVRSAAFVGSPGRVESPLRLVRVLARVPRWMVPRLPLRLYARALAFAADFVETPVHRLLANPRHLGRGFAARAMINMVEDIPAPLAADFARWLAGDGALTLRDGQRVEDGLRDAEVPALFIAGAADRIAPPEAVRVAFEAWGERTAVEKRFVLLDAEDAPYGHTDLVLGVFASRDVFPLLVEHFGGTCPTDPDM